MWASFRVVITIGRQRDSGAWRGRQDDGPEDGVVRRWGPPPAGA